MCCVSWCCVVLCVVGVVVRLLLLWLVIVCCVGVVGMLVVRGLFSVDGVMLEKCWSLFVVCCLLWYSGHLLCIVGVGVCCALCACWLLLVLFPRSAVCWCCVRCCRLVVAC